MLERGDDSVPPLSAALVGPRAERTGAPLRDARPAAAPSPTAAGRPAPSERTIDAPADPAALREEVRLLRIRARQQDEALVRLSDALSALRSRRQALHEENRELRLALQAMRQRRSRPSDQAAALLR